MAHRAVYLPELADASEPPERLTALKDAREVVQCEVDKFTASPVFRFNKVKYFCLILMSYATVWIAGNWTPHFWKWHLLQYLVLVPVQVYRWSLMKKLALMTEFCWITNFCIMLYLAAGLLTPSFCRTRFGGILSRMLFGFGSGPLGLSVVFTGNALVPHSIDHDLMLLIHLQPMVTAYTLKYYGGEHAMFLAEDDAVGFWEYFLPPLGFIVLHSVFHSMFFVGYGLKLRGRGYETGVDDVISSTGDDPLTRLVGRADSGIPERLRFLRYEALLCASIASLVALTYPLYLYGNGPLACAIVVIIFAASAWNGAEWYEYRIGRITSQMDELVSAEESFAKARDSHISPISPWSPPEEESIGKPFKDSM